MLTTDINYAPGRTVVVRVSYTCSENWDLRKSTTRSGDAVRRNWYKRSQGFCTAECTCRHIGRCRLAAQYEYTIMLSPTNKWIETEPVTLQFWYKLHVVRAKLWYVTSFSSRAYCSSVTATSQYHKRWPQNRLTSAWICGITQSISIAYSPAWMPIYHRNFELALFYEWCRPDTLIAWQATGNSLLQVAAHSEMREYFISARLPGYRYFRGMQQDSLKRQRCFRSWKVASSV